MTIMGALLAWVNAIRLYPSGLRALATTIATNCKARCGSGFGPSRKCGPGESMDARVEAAQERLPDARQAPSGVAFSFGYFSLGHAREK
jgi:hypothetical protein